MTLLTQTADRAYNSPFMGGTQQVGALMVGAVPVPFNSQYLPATVAWGATFTGTCGSHKWYDFVQVVAPLALWQAQSSWPINLALNVGFGYLALPPAGSKRVSGTFTDQNLAGISRNGFIIDRATGAFLTSFTSDSFGHFDGYVPTTNPVIALLLPNVGDSRNVVGMDKLVPI